MYVLAQIWQDRNTLEYDGFNPIGVYITYRAAEKALWKAVREARKADYYVRESYLPQPYESYTWGLSAEVWLQNSDSTMIMVIRKVHEYNLDN